MALNHVSELVPFHVSHRWYCDMYVGIYVRAMVCSTKFERSRYKCAVRFVDY